MTLSHDEQKSIIERLSKSKTFSKASTSSALLLFLHKAQLEERFLKEGIVDIEFFGKKNNEDKNSPRVRVSMYNLRKKLDSYYEKEGAQELYKVVLDKGQYNLRFVKEKTDSRYPIKDVIPKAAPYLLFCITLLFFILKDLPPPKPVLWKTFFNNAKPTTLYFGDAFGFYGETITGNKGWTRDFSINSLEEYYAFMQDKPHLKEVTRPPNFFYVTGMSVFATQKLSKLFNTFNQDFKLRSSTSSTFADIKAGNSIYVGMAKNNNKFISTFNDGNPYARLKNNNLYIKDFPAQMDTVIKVWTDGKTSDIAIVSRLHSSAGNEQFFFFSAHDMGAMATVEYFTNRDSMKVFEKRFLNGKQNFTAVYRATGHERTNLDLETIMVMPF